MKTQISNPRRSYDPSLRELVRETGNIGVALKLGVPRSTAMSWRTSPARPVISHELFDRTDDEVRARILKLEKQVKVLMAIMLLLLTVVRSLRHKLNWERLPEGKAKRRLLLAIERARGNLPRRATLPIVGLSSTR